MTEKQMLEAVTQAQEWIEETAGKEMLQMGRYHAINLLEIIEAQKGLCLVAWDENRQLKIKNSFRESQQVTQTHG